MFKRFSASQIRQRFIWARQWGLCQLDESTVSRFFLRSTFIWSSHLRLSLPRCLISTGCSTKILHTFLNAPMFDTLPCRPSGISITLMIFDGEYKLRNTECPSNVQTQTLTLRTLIWEVPGSNLGRKNFAVYSTSPGKFQGSTLE
jgi:hypothetical protein